MVTTKTQPRTSGRQPTAGSRGTRSVNIFGGGDPGLSGAVAAVRFDGTLVGVHDAPTITMKRGRRNAREHDIAGCLEALRDLAPDVFWLEEVNAMGKGGRTMGATSAFSFGGSYWMWRTLLIAEGIRHEVQRPQVWKKQLPGIGKDKPAAVAMARRLWPDAPWTGSQDANAGRADALLLAEACRRLHMTGGAA